MLDIMIKAFTGALASDARGTAAQARDTYRDYSVTSISQYTKATRSEPITMIDSRLQGVEALPNLMTTLTSIYAAMYLQSFALATSRNIDGVRIDRVLEKINPNSVKSKGGYVVDLLSDKNPLTLPGLGELPNYVTLESSVTTKDAIKEVTQFSSNLTTGIVFEAKTTRDEREVGIPISVRLIANRMDNGVIQNIFESAVVNRTAKERYHEWRSGGLNFWQDVILCKDIRTNFRKNYIKDKTGLYGEVVKRQQTKVVGNLIGGNPSVSLVSNIMVVSQETIDSFERASTKRFSDERTRNLIFNNVSCLIIAVVDTDYEVVRFYYHDQTVPTEATFSALKSGSSNGGAPDVMEILKAFQMGNNVRI